MQVRVVPPLASKRAGKVRIPLGSQFSNDPAEAFGGPYSSSRSWIPSYRAGRRPAARTTGAGAVAGAVVLAVTTKRARSFRKTASTVAIGS